MQESTVCVAGVYHRVAAVKVRRYTARGGEDNGGRGERKKRNPGKKFADPACIGGVAREHRVKIAETDTLGRLSGRARDPVNISFIIVHNTLYIICV